MRPEAFLYLYGRRIRTHPVQELLAGLGVAVGVALAFGVMVANASISGSAQELTRSIAGSADLQLQARSVQGFDEAVLAAVEAIPEVRHAGPILQQRAVVTVGRHRVVAQLIGVDARLGPLSDLAPRSLVSVGRALGRGIVLSDGLVQALRAPGGAGRAHRLERVDVAVGGRAFGMPVGEVPSARGTAALAQARVAVLGLSEMQARAHLPGRITRILIDLDAAGAERGRRALAALAQEHDLTLSDPGIEDRMLKLALGPSSQATGFFAGVAVLLGFLLAFSAILITAPERRSTVVDLRVYSAFKVRQMLSITLFQALVLGVLASGIGVLAGIPISRTILRESPDYLSLAFLLGDRTVIGVLPVVVALIGGVLACCLASLLPLADIRRGRPLDAILEGHGAPGQSVKARTRTRMLLGGVLSSAIATVLLLAQPTAALPAMTLLAVATVLVVPACFAGVLRILGWLIVRFDRLGLLTLAVFALRSTRFRALALAATGTVAVFGSVAVGSARDDLLRGISAYTSDYVSTADIWVTNVHDTQAIGAIRVPGLAARVAAVRDVAAVRLYRGGYLDVGSRRIWVIARPAADRAMLPPSQVIRGDPRTATARLRSGGWAAVSDQVAKQQRVGIGGLLTLPTPTGPVRYRVAAIVTNLGWPPGTVILNGADFRRAWGSADPSALEVDVRAGAGLAETRAAVARAVGAHSGLQVQTAAKRAAEINASAQLGLKRLGQISRMLLVAAVLAMAAAMSTAIWQSRLGFAGLRLQHFSPLQIWIIVLIESAIMLATGYATGVAIGTYGQIVIDRYLDLVTGFPLVIRLIGWPIVETVGAVLAVALVIIAVPGWLAARVPATRALEE